MRVKLCCSGCSLQTGTLMLLRLDLIHQSWIFISLAGAVCFSKQILSFVEWGRLGWSPFMLVMVIYGMFGVEKHRPSYLLPYICVNILFFIGTILVTFMFCVGSRTLREDIFRSMCQLFSELNFIKFCQTHEYNTIETPVILVLILGNVLHFFFIVVIYCYYEQIQKEDQGIRNPPSGTGYISYAAPAVRAQGNVYPK